MCWISGYFETLEVSSWRLQFLCGLPVACALSLVHLGRSSQDMLDKTISPDLENASPRSSANGELFANFYFPAAAT